MLTDIIRALLLGAVPVGAFTFLVLQWSVSAGKLQPFSDSKSLDKQFNAQKKAKSEAKKAAKLAAKQVKAAKSEKLSTDVPETEPAKYKNPFHKDAGRDFFHSKIMFFGGGFYGTMALFAYTVIEIEEIWQFLGVVFTPGEWFRNLGFDLIIQFLINSVMNIVAAFTWFMTLPDYVDIGNGWIWLGAAYIGYMAGVRIVAEAGDDVWAALIAWRDSAFRTVGEQVKRIKEKS